MSDENDLIKLTVLALKLGEDWRVSLYDAIQLQRKVFVRLKGNGTLTVCDKINSETTEATFKKVDLKNQLWELPDRELEQFVLDNPPWKISKVVSPAFVLAKPQTFQFEILPESVNENDLFLLRITNETENQSTNKTNTTHLATDNKEANKPSSLTVSDPIDLYGKRKIHTRFIAVAKHKNLERASAWKWFIDLAQESRGQTEVDVPGSGNTFLRRVRTKPEKEILYSHEMFDYDKADNLPDGVEKFTFDQFQTSWTDFNTNRHEGIIKES
jgi:hypothetical protein